MKVTQKWLNRGPEKSNFFLYHVHYGFQHIHQYLYVLVTQKGVLWVPNFLGKEQRLWQVTQYNSYCFRKIFSWRLQCSWQILEGPIKDSAAGLEPHFRSSVQSPCAVISMQGVIRFLICQYTHLLWSFGSYLKIPLPALLSTHFTSLER